MCLVVSSINVRIVVVADDSGDGNNGGKHVNSKITVIKTQALRKPRRRTKDVYQY